MSNLNIGEIGAIIRVNLGYDISSSTPSIILLPEVGEVKEFDNVVIPVVDYSDDLETLNAGEYIEYTTKDGDLNYVGRWKKKARIKVSDSDISQSDFIKFRVLP